MQDKSKEIPVTKEFSPPTPTPNPPQLLGVDDGWHFVKDHPQLHYFFKEASLCRLYQNKPPGTVHKNVPILHCSKCEQVLKKLLGVQTYLVGKKLNASQVFALLEILERIKLNKGLTDKEQTAEHSIVVLGHKNGTKTVTEKGKNPNGISRGDVS